MIQPDPVLERLSKLDVVPVDELLSRRIRARAVRALDPGPMSAVWTVAVTTSAVAYLAWAIRFTLALHSGSHIVP